jgi:cyanate permease
METPTEDSLPHVADGSRRRAKRVCLGLILAVAVLAGLMDGYAPDDELLYCIGVLVIGTPFAIAALVWIRSDAKEHNNRIGNALQILTFVFVPLGVLCYFLSRRQGRRLFRAIGFAASTTLVYLGIYYMTFRLLWGVWPE